VSYSSLPISLREHPLSLGTPNGRVAEAADQELARIFEDLFGVETAELDGDQKLHDLKQWDSLRHMEFVLQLEQGYGFQLTGDEIAAMDTVASVQAIVAEKFSVSAPLASTEKTDSIGGIDDSTR
jgi:acyl carrier protein